MTSEIKQAFAHPELRAQATEGGGFPDRISVRDHIEQVEIGAFQSERGVTQRLQFDLVVEIAPAGGNLADDVDLILSYDVLTDAIRAELALERFNLLETLAERIAARILTAPQALRVFVRIQKLDRGSGKLGVEIVRGGQAHRDCCPGVDHPPRPICIFLQNAALHGEHIGLWVEKLQHLPDPLVFCVDLPQKYQQHSDALPTQRHIDLLEIEQTAWALAAALPELVVVHSRTELDWGMNHKQLSLWAPSKMVLDAVKPPPGQIDGLGLAHWLAEQLEAKRLIVIGDAPVRSDNAEFFDYRQPELL
ncbi:MAG: diguanylate cyclase [Rhodobacterales bacterium]|nr:MAG: diguanylate cyclase [Rhodobacterales bacterium]